VCDAGVSQISVMRRRKSERERERTVMGPAACRGWVVGVGWEAAWLVAVRLGLIEFAAVVRDQVLIHCARGRATPPPSLCVCPSHPLSPFNAVPSLLPSANQ